jgi:UrcA family protein
MPVSRLLEVKDMLGCSRFSFCLPKRMFRAGHPLRHCHPAQGQAGLAARLVLVAGLAATALAGMANVPAKAADGADNPSLSVPVSTKGFDLSNKADLAKLRHRIDSAASKVCEWVMDGQGATNPGFVDCFLRAASEGRKQLEIKVAQARGNGMVASAGH